MAPQKQLLALWQLLRGLASGRVFPVLFSEGDNWLQVSSACGLEFGGAGLEFLLLSLIWSFPEGRNARRQQRLCRPLPTPEDLATSDRYWSSLSQSF